MCPDVDPRIAGKNNDHFVITRESRVRGRKVNPHRKAILPEAFSNQIENWVLSHCSINGLRWSWLRVTCVAMVIRRAVSVAYAIGVMWSRAEGFLYNETPQTLPAIKVLQSLDLFWRRQDFLPNAGIFQLPVLTTPYPAPAADASLPANSC